MSTNISRESNFRGKYKTVIFSLQIIYNGDYEVFFITPNHTLRRFHEFIMIIFY